MRKTVLLFLLAVACLTVQLHAQQIPAAIDTDPPADAQYPAAMETFLLPSHGSQLNALMYIAAGAGPHPVVVLLHGFPGNEKNLDLAQVMRRAGWNVLYFNYRGSWGSPGDFSFTHATEDVASALVYLRDPAHAVKLRADPTRVVLIGHSMGGFMAAYGGSHDSAVLGVGMISAADLGGSFANSPKNQKLDPKAKVSAVATSLAAEGMAPLNGCTPESLASELVGTDGRLSFAKLAAGLAAHPVLLVTSDDGLAPMSQSLAETLRKDGDKQMTELHLPTDHSYSDKRIALEKAVLAWLGTLQ